MSASNSTAFVFAGRGSLGATQVGMPTPTQRKVALHLHARGIVIPLSKSKPPIAVTAEPPEYMRAALGDLGWVPAARPSSLEQRGLESSSRQRQ